MSMKHILHDPAVILVAILLLLVCTFAATMAVPPVTNCTKMLLGAETKNEALTFLGVSMGGVLVALQALMSYRRAKAMEDTSSAHAKANENASLESAIKHLGNDSVSVRLAGVHELIHLAKNVKGLREPVLDILCSRIRQATRDQAYTRQHDKRPSEEIQSMLTLMFVKWGSDLFNESVAELQGSWLNGIELSDAWLCNAVLSEANLQSAQLMKANLESAELMNAHLEKANLSGATLRSVAAMGVELEGGYLVEADVREADMRCADLRGADFTKAKKTGWNIEGARTENVKW